MCARLSRGRSYVSDGFAHALEFTVNGVAPGGAGVLLDQPSPLRIKARVAFAPETPLTVAQGVKVPPDGRQFVGDTKTLHGPRTKETVQGGTRTVEVVMNGRAVASMEAPAHGQVHELHFEVRVERSSWVALRHFPQLHTNPVNVQVAGRPIRASRSSALWCIETINQVWRTRSEKIPDEDRAAARAAFDEAIAAYRRIASEAPEGS